MDPTRKPNRIPEYDYSHSGAYFVTICTQGRKCVLSDIVGDGFPVPRPWGRIAEKWIEEVPKKYPAVSVDRYVIMPDHIHLLLRFNTAGEALCLLNGGTGNPSPTLGNVVGWYKYQVTKQVDLASKTQGEKLFQRSYYDHVIRNQQDYNEIWEYIENNPKKWILTKQGWE